MTIIPHFFPASSVYQDEKKGLSQTQEDNIYGNNIHRFWFHSSYFSVSVGSFSCGFTESYA